ncbi:hypothetical protein DLAC_02807 [Tieghemostelium lacteum]|uniref:Uncharacterized protein n=1 Tax=Tieghemostelium lacteum TaxID=361077 RepID=A0A152A3I5_TIELA|nr:hypothetical protein DLAC_02807 [Tieghemostelium lacteum]|eukprot:KYR00764.1 hypothetical protein DLAC_02807 [Tieghemostelium lacteum]
MDDRNKKKIKIPSKTNENNVFNFNSFDLLLDIIDKEPQLEESQNIEDDEDQVENILFNIKNASTDQQNDSYDSSDDNNSISISDQEEISYNNNNNNNQSNNETKKKSLYNTFL